MNTLVFDAHLDLSLNALEYNRDLRQPVADLRASEAGQKDKRGRGGSTVAFPEMRKGRVGLCVATLIGGCMKPPIPVACWNSPAQAWAMTQGQVAWYRAMEDEGELRQICDLASLETHLDDWATDPETSPIGYILSIEGVDSFRTLDDLDDAVNRHGLRAVGPAHYGTGRYALGHNEKGRLPAVGKDLLHKMREHDLILDLTHLCDGNFFDALDFYDGTVWASHHNCRSLVNDPRQLSDEQIKLIGERGGVIGVAMDVWMIVPGWDKAKTSDENPTANFSTLADHVDHVCQLLGTSQHTGIGSDLDGGFGKEQSPSDLDTIADLPLFFEILAKRGYSQDDIEGIAHRNFIDLLRSAWASRKSEW